MTEPQPQRRMAENEVVYRQYNQAVKERFEKIKRRVKEDKHTLTPSDDTRLDFYCECADEHCKKRVRLTPYAYSALHRRKDRFVVLPGHESELIERVVKREEGYNVVEKYLQPPESGTTLKPTSLDNT